MEMFAKAAKKGLTFTTSKGQMTVSQVWQMPLTSHNDFNLTVLSRDVLAATRVQAEENLVESVSTNTDDGLRLDILKFIIGDIKEAKAKQLRASEKRALEQKIAAVLEQKSDDALHNKTVEELQALLKSTQED